MWPPRAAQAPHSEMSDSSTAEHTGAVVALVVATAPGAALAARNRLWSPLAGRLPIQWLLRALAPLERLSACALIVPPEYADAARAGIQSEANMPRCDILPVAGDSWRDTLVTVNHLAVVYDEVVVLDAALPLTPTAAIRAGVAAAERAGVAIAGEPVKETLKLIAGATVVETPNRASLVCLLSPAVFQRSALQQALAATEAPERRGADLIELARSAGRPLNVFGAGYPGLRATHAEDRAILETLLEQQKSER